ncbi:hypothetical protein SVIOM74S_04143 [Streptomyces violarus]
MLHPLHPRKQVDPQHQDRPHPAKQQVRFVSRPTAVATSRASSERHDGQAVPSTAPTPPGHPSRTTRCVRSTGYFFQSGQCGVNPRGARVDRSARGGDRSPDGVGAMSHRPAAEPRCDSLGFYYDTAGTAFPRQVPALLNLAEPERVLFGSDYWSASRTGRRPHRGGRRGRVTGRRRHVAFPDHRQRQAPVPGRVTVISIDSVRVPARSPQGRRRHRPGRTTPIPAARPQDPGRRSAAVTRPPSVPAACGGTVVWVPSGRPSPRAVQTWAGRGWSP